LLSGRWSLPGPQPLFLLKFWKYKSPLLQDNCPEKYLEKFHFPTRLYFNSQSILIFLPMARLFVFLSCAINILLNFISVYIKITVLESKLENTKL
jgi:dimeric dUTPase (all-alpha-NTP-PPase superfamily)